MLPLEKTMRVHVEDDGDVFWGWGLFEDFADVGGELAGGGGF